MPEPTSGALSGTTPPGDTTTTPPVGGTPWFGADHAPLVQTKGWKAPDDVIKSYGDLEKFVGAPADRLIKLPEKADAPEWGDIRARVGWKAPEKPEDYGIKTPDGQPPEYAQAITTAAHKLGVPKDTLLALAAENDKYVQGEMARREALYTQRAAATETEIKAKLGDKYVENTELVQRELTRLGLDADAVASIEAAAAMHGDGKALTALRMLLAEHANSRKEQTLHQGGGGSGSNPATAKATLDAKMADAAWSAQALRRGTPEAIERMQLIAAASGTQMSAETATALAKGAS